MANKEIEKMTNEELEAKRIDLEAKAKKLIGNLGRYYNYLPDECWKTEETQVTEMRKRFRFATGISRRAINKWKRQLERLGLVLVEKVKNGNRSNLKHIIRKTLPIVLDRLGVEGDQL